LTYVQFISYEPHNTSSAEMSYRCDEQTKLSYLSVLDQISVSFVLPLCHSEHLPGGSVYSHHSAPAAGKQTQLSNIQHHSKH